jgi:tRNA threonylcarbamoyladenosine biosynthesis protein TsaB
MLAIDCATEACSLALFEGGELLAASHQILGRGHAEHLVPLIAALPDRGRAAEIRVSLGPGSFTGVRIGLAAARALGFAWGATVVGFPTLALVAATARHQHPGPVSVCMAGGHGEWFVQDFDAIGLPEGQSLSVDAEVARSLGSHAVIAGNRAQERAGLVSEPREVLAILPDARFVPDLPDSLLLTDLSPIYGRPPDARLPT